MMNLTPIFILAFTVLLPASILCGETVSENTSSMNKFNSLHPKKSNSSYSLSRNVIVKREIPESEMSYYRIPSDIMVKRTAAGLSNFFYGLRNPFDKSASPIDNEIGSRESDNFSGDVARALARGSINDRYPTAVVERRGQKDRKIYLRCYFNAVSCFRKK